MNRREWCGNVAKLVSPSFPEDATAALLDMLPAFRHMPDTLFCEATVIEVARVKRRQTIPAFDEITAVLNEYRRTFVFEPPVRPRLDAPEPERPDTGPNLCDEEREAVLAAFRAKMHASWAETHAGLGEFRPPVFDLPLRDVTLKGEALRRARLEAGIDVPVPELDDEFGPPPPDTEQAA